ncbi:hypothetical protein LAZ67_X000913 [Cordylochernes scorpioides]|uniref:Uncharacterized protein n=1 Tax=Cordylochernes scorpioides TaxID=51811 RepID=A0ABY6LWX3_9ARAC|nr:hypothetical protein LAZ67_X000913 [Cordylochernes scorpioides]
MKKEFFIEFPHEECILSNLGCQNPTAPSPLGQMPPNDGMPGGPMPPGGFFPHVGAPPTSLAAVACMLLPQLCFCPPQNSHMRPSPPQQQQPPPGSAPPPQVIRPIALIIN